MSPRDKEYRLIPYEADDRADQVELSDLLNVLWRSRNTILWIVLAFAFYGAFRSLAEPEEFTSSAVITPVMEQQTQLPAFLQQFSGMIGGITGGTSADQIQVQLYPEIIYSSRSMYNLIHQPIYVASMDSSISVMDYMLIHREYTMLSRVTGTLLDYTIHLPITLVKHAYTLFRTVLSYLIGEAPSSTAPGSGGSYSANRADVASLSDLAADLEPDRLAELDPRELSRALDLNRPIRMSIEEAEFIDDMIDRITTQLSGDTGLFRLEVKMPDPEIAAQVNQIVLDYLTAFVTNYRTQKTLRNLAFITERNEIAEKEYLEAERKLTDFQDRNISLVTARARSEEQRLMSDFQLRFDLYNVLRQRKEEARIQLEEVTPVFNFMEPVSIPPGRSSPRRVLMVVLFAFAGGVIGVFWTFIRYAFHTRSGPAGQ